MKVLLVSQSDIGGGAARATYRLHLGLLAHGIDSRMKVRIKQSDDWTVAGPKSRLEKVTNSVRPLASGFVKHLHSTANSNLHTGNWLPSRWAHYINGTDADVVNLHWVAGETLSIEDIGRIAKPIVWTLHDMWPFCGMEHYAADIPTARWRQGYSPRADPGFDLDRRAWLRKQRHWRRRMHIVAPSAWLANCARQSTLFQPLNVRTIPNTLDTAVFQPLDRSLCRQALVLPPRRQIILFGAIGGARDPRKGFDLLRTSLCRLSERVPREDVLCVVFGQGEPRPAPILPFEVRWIGHVHDSPTLALLYNAADVMVVPSRQEAFGQTASEAQACGCPVVAFDCTGLRDVVSHRESGYLACAYDTDDMAHGLYELLTDSAMNRRLGECARARAVDLWRTDRVVDLYTKVYCDAMVK